MLIFFIILLIIGALMEALSLQNALKNLSYQAEPSEHVVDPMQRFEIVSTVKNEGYMPHAFLKLTESLPNSIKLPGGERFARPQVSGLSDDVVQAIKISDTFYLMPKSVHTRRIAAYIERRGRYFLGSAALSGGDFLGLKEVSEHYTRFSEIVVLPQRAEDRDVDNALGGFLGDVSVRRFIMEDPVLTLGFREYTGREPQKAISWPVSLASGRLMVKNHDFTLDPGVTVLLNVDGGEGEDKERCFSLARSVCEALEKKGVKYAFITNAAAAGSIGTWSKIGEGLGSRHLFTILEGLGRATYDCTMPYSGLLDTAARAAEAGRCHILITADEGAAEGRELSKLRELTGGEVLVIA